MAGDEFYITMQCGIEAEAAKLGVTVKTQGPQKFDPTLQRPILDSVKATKPDAILIAPTDVTAMQQPLEGGRRGRHQGRSWWTPPPKDPSYAASQIASDNIGGGKAAFDAIKQLNPDGGKVMVMSVEPGHLHHRPARPGLRGGREGRLQVPVPRPSSTRTTTRPPRPT